MTPIERAKSDLAKLKVEISRLEFQLQSAEHRRDKVAAYIEMAEIYEAEESTIENGQRAKGGISGAAVRASIDAIRERRARIHTRELIEILAKQGIAIGGSNPVANLSGFLSRSEELHNSRADGWGLALWLDEPPQQEGRAAKLLRDAGAVMPKETEQETGAPEEQNLSPWGIENEKAASDLDDDIPF